MDRIPSGLLFLDDTLDEEKLLGSELSGKKNEMTRFGSIQDLLIDSLAR